MALLVIGVSSCSKNTIRKDRAYGPEVAQEASVHPVRVHLPETVGVLDTNVHDIKGNPVGISCVTCHGSGKENAFVYEKDVPKDFHGKMKVAHGTTTCYSCHDKQDRTKLHLADGTKLGFDQSQKLCAQCHGVQYRDYTKGSHGGMTGYWDLKRGPRDRNSCLNCHSPHTPKFAKVRPVHPPKDRFLEWKEAHEDPKGKEHE